MSSTGAGDEFRQEVERAAEQERRIQREIDVKEQRSFQDEEEDRPMQAGAREYPAPPLPEQHLDKPGIEAVGAFLDQTINHGADLVLPMHGGPPITDPATTQIQAEAYRILNSVLERGRRDATIRPDIKIADLILFGALLAQQLPHVENWPRAARRLAGIFLAGLAPTAGRD